MSSFVTHHTSSHGTVIVQSTDGSYFTTSQFFLMKSCLDRLKRHVSHDIRKSLKNGIDHAHRSKTHVTINVTAKVYRMLKASNKAGDVLNPKSFGFTKTRTVVGVVGAGPVITLGGSGIGFAAAAPMPVITAGGTGFGVVAAAPMPVVGVVGGHGAGAFVPVSMSTTSSKSSRHEKPSEYFHRMLTWSEAKGKLDKCFYRKFHTWCGDEHGWNFSYHDDASMIPGRFVVEFNKKKWGIKKKTPSTLRSKLTWKRDA